MACSSNTAGKVNMDDQVELYQPVECPASYRQSLSGDTRQRCRIHQTHSLYPEDI
jgi:hypothetical protein